MPTVIINGKKHTPSSGTLKKMKRKAAMEAAAKADKPKGKKAKAPVPRPRSDRPSKSRKPGDAREYSSFDKKSSSDRPSGKSGTVIKLKGKVADLPSKKKAAMTASADAKVKADAAREEMLKKSKGSAADMAYAKKIRGK